MESKETNIIITDLPNRTPTERMLDVSQIPSMAKDNNPSIMYPGFNSSAEVSRLRETLIEVSNLQQAEIAKAFKHYDEQITQYFKNVTARTVELEDNIRSLEVVLECFMQWVMLSESHEPEQLKKLQQVMVSFLKRNQPPPAPGSVYFDTCAPGSVGG